MQVFFKKNLTEATILFIIIVMGIFGKRIALKPLKRRGKTNEEIEKTQERKEKQWARERLLEKTKNNPELENAYISKLIGIDLRNVDPTEKQREEFNAAINISALELIKEDPDLKEELARQRAYDMLNVKRPRHGDDEGLRYAEDDKPISRVLEELEQYEELRGRFGGDNKGILGGLIDKDVMIQLIQTLGPMILSRAGQQPQLSAPPPERRIIVSNPEGQMVELSESQYNDWASKGMIRPIAAIAAPPEIEKPPETKTEPKKVEPPKPPPAPPGTATQLSIGQSKLPEDFNFTTLAGYLELPPEEFVDQFGIEIEAGNEQAKMIWDFISISSYDTIYRMITPYQSDATVGMYVEKLLTPEGRKWVEEVVARIKEKSR